MRSGPLAQSVEQGTFNPKAAGSIPSRPTTDFSKTGSARLFLTGPWCNGSTGVFGALSPGSNPGGPAIVLNAVLRTAFFIAAAKPSCTPYCLSAFGLRTEVRGASASRQYGAPGGFSLSGVRMWHLGNSPAQPFQKKFSKSWEMFWTARGGSCNISIRVTCAMRRCGSVGRAAHS